MFVEPDAGFKIVSHAMQEVLEEIYDYAFHGRSCVFYGPTGTGKEYVARYYYQIYHRINGYSGPFLSLNCSGLSTDLAASELFGHTRGAFTGAVTDKSGLFEKAENGILFLDEIGELPKEIQAQLLRAMDSNIQEARRVGSAESYSTARVLVIAATDKGPDSLILPLRMRFGKEVMVPDVSHRREDIPNAVLYFAIRSIRKRKDVNALLCSVYGSKEISQITGPQGYDAVGFLAERISVRMTPEIENQQWPGNFREIRNIVDTAIIRAQPTANIESFVNEVMHYYHFHQVKNSGVERFQYSVEHAVSDLPYEEEILSEIRTLLPRISEREKLEWATALTRLMGRVFYRYDLDAFIRKVESRTIQQRLKVLEKHGFISRHGNRGEKYYLNWTKDKLEALPLFTLPLRPPGYYLLSTQESKHIYALLENTRCLFIKGEKNKSKTLFLDHLCHLLNEDYTLLYHTFGSAGIAEFLDKAVILLLEVQLVESEEVEKFKDLVELVHYLADIVNQWAKNQINPLIFLNNTDTLISGYDIEVLNEILKSWSAFTFVLEGCKLSDQLKQDKELSLTEYPFY
ncbi:MAG: sigma 54-interacting transcriptional regulator [Saprospiraceae bacterium]|nr:sigma 54-interacting transcriptional regulator [Saprospiraceae bacterium]